MNDDKRTIRLFLLDDHELVRRGVRQLLEFEEDIEVVGEAATAKDAILGIAITRPDVAILDVRLAESSGVEVCRQVRSDFPGVACLMLTSFSDDEALMDAVMAGASGYVLKEVLGNHLVSDIRAVAAGRSLLPAAIVARLMDRVLARRQRDPANLLTRQEQKILELIAEGKSNRQIAQEMYLSEKTVKNYVSQLLRKLGLSSRTEAAVYVLRQDERPGSDPFERQLARTGR